MGDEGRLILERAPAAPPLPLRAHVVRLESTATGAHKRLAFEPAEAAGAVPLPCLPALSARHLASALRP